MRRFSLLLVSLIVLTVQTALAQNLAQWKNTGEVF